MNFEKLIQKYAIVSNNIDEVNIAPTQEIFGDMGLTQLSEGLQSRVFSTKNKKWVIKEARWDLSIKLFNKLDFKLPFEEAEDFLKSFGFCFLPKIEEVLRQFSDYLVFIKYFGYFVPFNYHYPDIKEIKQFQHHLRTNLVNSIPEIEQHYGFKINPKINKILKSRSKYANFLVKEYLIYGPGISPSNKGKNTSFIIQKYVRGTMLHDLNLRTLSWRQKKQIVVMIYLILLMNLRENILPDTRPRYPMTEASDWLLKTDNVISNLMGLKFIDTRWFWDKRTNIIERGLLIPEMIINGCKYYLDFLLND